MKTIFKNTVIDILLSKSSLYTLLFGSFFLMIGYGLRFTIGISSGDSYHDISHYQTVIYLHIFLYIFYATLVAGCSSDLEEEIKERFHELTLIYIPRIKYFLTKYIAYLFGYFFLLMLIGCVGAVLCKILLGIALNLKFFLGLVFISFNIAFLLSLFLLFSLKTSPRGSSLFAFLLYIFFSLLNSKTIIKWVTGFEKISGIISTLSPSVFWLQNEWLRFGLGWGFSDRFWQYLLNLSIYLFLSFFILSKKINRYECKA